MNITTEIIVDDLYKILTSQISQERFYKARAGGFRNELEFEKVLREGRYDLLDPGQFLITKKNNHQSVENEMIYVTVSDDDKSRYVEFYKQITRLDEVKNSFFVSVLGIHSWETEPFTVKNESKKNIDEIIIKPKFSVCKFNEGTWTDSSFNEIKDLLIKRERRISAKKSKEYFEYLKSYEIEDIAKIYANRYFLDVELASYNKGMMDFDHILSYGGKFIVVETKEKDPMKNEKNPTDREGWSFGWDSRRFGWYLYLRHQIELESWYVVREIKEQQQREFLGWKIIQFDKFCRCASWLKEVSGGGGGGTISAPYLAFENFNPDQCLIND